MQKSGANETYNFVTLETTEKHRSRTGDKLMISNSKGQPINIKLNDNNLFDITDKEQERVKQFINLLASLMGWESKLEKWNFNNLKLREFSKGILDGKGEHKVLNQKNYIDIVENKCFSMAITSSQAIEYIIDDRNHFN